MTQKEISFADVVRITFNNKMTLMSSCDKFIHANWICVWCKYNMYIGTPYINVPEDLLAWFLPPRQYEEYVKIIEKKGGH